MQSLIIQEPRRLIREAVRCVKTASDMRWVARVNGSPLDHARHAQFLRWAAAKRLRAAKAIAAYAKTADGPSPTPILSKVA
jgi:hypothetical protein